MTKTPLYAHLGLSLLMTGLAGCTGLGSIAGNDTLSIESTPPEATVFVMEEAVGKTPIELSQQTLFPSTYAPDKQHLYGQVILRKPGCEDHEARISSSAIARGLQVTLKCGEVAKQVATTPSAAPSANKMEEATHEPAIAETPATLPVSQGSLPAKERLQRIDELKREGLIDEGEYREVRQRILDSL